MRVIRQPWWLCFLLALMACEPSGRPGADAGSADAGGTDAGIATGKVSGTAFLPGVGPHDGIVVSLLGTGLETTTKADGQFLLEDVPGGTHELVAQKPGYSRQQQPVSVKAGGSVSVSLSLVRLVGRVEGKIQLGGAASHAGISVTLEGARLSTTTRADGGFLLESVPVGTYTLVAVKAGHVTGRQAVEVKAAETVTPFLSLERLVARVTGRVTLKDASSHEGITVALENTGLSVTTAADGAFTLEPAPVGTYTLVTTKAGYVTGRQSVTVKESETVTLTLSLSLSVGWVSGRVLLQDTNNHAGGTVSLEGTSLSTTTAADGSFTLAAVPVGTYTLVAVKAGWTAERQSVLVKEGQTVTINASLVRRVGRLEGRVTLNDTSAHAGISVSLRGTDVRTTTAADGSFTLAVVQVGTYTLEASKPGYRTRQQSVEVLEGQTASLTLSLERILGRVDGRFTLKDTTTHEGIDVILQGSGLRTTTAADGTYSLAAVPVGTYTLQVSKASYSTLRLTVVVEEGEAPPVSGSLSPAFGTVWGEVTLAGSPSYGSGFRASLEGTSFSAVTDSAGFFRFQGVRTGTYWLVVEKADYQTARVSIQVSDGQTLFPTVEMRLAPGRVQGSLQLQGETSSAGATVSVLNTSYSVVTGADGVFSLEAIPVGLYTLKAEKAGHVTVWRNLQVYPAKTTTVALSLIRSPPTGRVAGQVMLDDTSAHAGISVTLEAQGLLLSTTTGANGGFSFEGVQTGRYILWAEKAPYTKRHQLLEVTQAQTTSVSLTLTRQASLSISLPRLVVQGGRVSLSGAGFGAQQGASTVSIGGVPVTEYLLWSDTQVQVQVPTAVSPGERDVVLSLAAGGTASAPIRVLSQVTLAGGGVFGLGLRTDTTVTAFGPGPYGETTVPQGLTGVVSVAAAYSTSFALKRDGTVVAWGNDGIGLLSVPAGLNDAVSLAGGSFTLALRQNGTLVGWGYDFGQPMPTGITDVVDIAAGVFHQLALKRDGTVVSWGYDFQNGVFPVPSWLSGVVDVAAGEHLSLVLTRDGTVTQWGEDLEGAMAIPPGLSDVVAVSAKERSAAALKRDGTVVSWGTVGAAPAGLSGVVAISVQEAGVLALKQDGSVVVWGNTSVPAGLVLQVPTP